MSTLFPRMHERPVSESPREWGWAQELDARDCVLNPRGLRTVEGGLGGLSLLVLATPVDSCFTAKLRAGLCSDGHAVTYTSNVNEALRELLSKRFHIVFVEWVNWPRMTREVFPKVTEVAEGTPIIVASSIVDPQTVVSLWRQGVVDFLPKPLSLADLRQALARAGSSPVSGNGVSLSKRYESQAPTGYDTPSSLLMGDSLALRALRKVTFLASQNNHNCLIQGPTGAGKDLVARELHRQSKRWNKPFIKVNCAALCSELFESELFGYERGAFSGVSGSKSGLFELAHEGVLFFDEICELPLDLQMKLLQVVEHKEFTKLGGTQTTRVDVKILAATNRDICKHIRTGCFRADLYYRLNEILIEVPPLSGHREDIPVLVRHFVRKYRRDFPTARKRSLTKKVLKQLINHNWPGNVRELESTVKRWHILDEFSIYRVIGDGVRTLGERMPTERTAVGRKELLHCDVQGKS